MPDKEPVLLVVLVETQELRWFIAGIDFKGDAFPLLCSAKGNLSPYIGVQTDEQLSFLRHRFSGVLQRGCDRLWGRRQKPAHIVFVTDGPFVDAAAELTQQVAEHMVEWMWNPPVVFYIGGESDDVTSMTQAAGELPNEMVTVLQTGLPAIRERMKQPDDWEQAPEKK